MDENLGWIVLLPADAICRSGSRQAFFYIRITRTFLFFAHLAHCMYYVYPEISFPCSARSYQEDGNQLLVPIVLCRLVYQLKPMRVKVSANM